VSFLQPFFGIKKYLFLESSEFCIFLHSLHTRLAYLDIFLGETSELCVPVLLEDKNQPCVTPVRMIFVGAGHATGSVVNVLMR